MCILLNLDYAKFGVSDLFIYFVFKSYGRKPTFGGSPLVKEGLKFQFPLGNIDHATIVFETCYMFCDGLFLEPTMS